MAARSTYRPDLEHEAFLEDADRGRTPIFPTPGEWKFACDSYGKVRHSRKACVYVKLNALGGERLHTIAARIPNWEDAKLIASAPRLLAALEELTGRYIGDLNDPAIQRARAAIAAARGEG